MLRICIPTYNRWDRLNIQLSSLAEAFSFRAEFTVDVFDNASTDNTPSNFHTLGLSTAFRILTHSENAGYEGNVLRILDFAQKNYAPSDLLWILSDDDFVFPSALANLVNWINKCPKVVPVLLTFLLLEGGKLQTRPPSPFSKGQLSSSALFDVINQTALISCWLYPIHLLKDDILEEMNRWKSNTFLQLVLISLILRKSSHFLQFPRPIGIEWINLSIRFGILRTFAIDRPSALLKAMNALNLNPEALDVTMRNIAQQFAKRAFVWECAGDSQSAAAAIEAMPEFARQGWLSPSARGFLLLIPLFKVLKRLGLAGPLIRRGSSFRNRAISSQQNIQSLFSAAPGPSAEDLSISQFTEPLYEPRLPSR